TGRDGPWHHWASGGAALGRRPRHTDPAWLWQHPFRHRRGAMTLVRLLLAMRAGRGAQGADDRSGNCSSLATESADGSGYQRAGVNRTEGDYDLVRAAPLGGMPPKG